MKDSSHLPASYSSLEKQRLLVKIYNQYVKIKLLEIIWVKKEECIWKIGKENRTCYLDKKRY